jgi:hypothetical protein
MAERKVLVKYYDPYFNPSKLVKSRRAKDRQDNVRMMLPFSVKCETCANYLYVGTKFNMRKELCKQDQYLSIKIFRFYFKCTYCYREILFKTDPKNHDYLLEAGGTRLYESWRDGRAAEELLGELTKNEEYGNVMKLLENKTFDSKKEMKVLEAIETLRQMSRANVKLTNEEVVERFRKMKDKGLFDEGEIKNKFKEMRLEKQKEGLGKEETKEEEVIFNKEEEDEMAKRVKKKNRFINFGIKKRGIKKKSKKVKKEILEKEEKKDDLCLVKNYSDSESD